ncbi:MAG TPA: bifunctional phosphoribosyl-AMP cyclohydrolase/phosphoribosyl-ATP diphosphatase HisIE [Longimicrobiaceae bacterium]|nr:bifunctional phosphoribosyl-AMP cyclohydrolase/phosphoribosyl-ATP diphosphatase HisIE [Longimicrobiaceae bacterium]
MSAWIEELKFDERGLVAVVAQEADTGEVLMVAWADREALARTVETGVAHYWSRSRGALWRKGETSGHVQAVREVRVDCDGDAVLYRVAQTGPACHTGEGSCFHRLADGAGLAPAGGTGHVLSRIEEIVRVREAERPEGSYTTYLFEKGVDKVLKKLGEEAAETIVAAKNPGTDELRSETADLLFHLLVLLRARGLPLAEVWAELEGRFGAPPRPEALEKLQAKRPPDHS